MSLESILMEFGKEKNALDEETAQQKSFMQSLNKGWAIAIDGNSNAKTENCQCESNDSCIEHQPEDCFGLFICALQPYLFD